MRAIIVWWSSDKTYKNSITNHLYLLTSAEGYNRNQNATYLANAEKVHLACTGYYHQLRITNSLFFIDMDLVYVFFYMSQISIDGLG